MRRDARSKDQSQTKKPEIKEIWIECLLDNLLKDRNKILSLIEPLNDLDLKALRGNLKTKLKQKLQGNCPISLRPFLTGEDKIKIENIALILEKQGEQIHIFAFEKAMLKEHFKRSNTNPANRTEVTARNVFVYKATLEDVRKKIAKTPAGQKPNLSWLNLAGIQFPENFDFGGANLTGANLTRTNLTGANLTKANLTKANLTGVILESTNLRGANLNETNLESAKLYEANLTGAVLTGANLKFTKLHEANLTGADLTGADLTEANLTEAILREANLTSADLKWAKLHLASFAKANLTGANFTGANLTGASLREANLTGANLRETNLTAANLTNATLTDAVIDTKTILTNILINNQAIASHITNRPAAKHDALIKDPLLKILFPTAAPWKAQRPATSAANPSASRIQPELTQPDQYVLARKVEITNGTKTKTFSFVPLSEASAENGFDKHYAPSGR